MSRAHDKRREQQGRTSRLVDRAVAKPSRAEQPPSRTPLAQHQLAALELLSSELFSAQDVHRDARRQAAALRNAEHVDELEMRAAVDEVLEALRAGDVGQHEQREMLAILDSMRAEL